MNVNTQELIVFYSIKKYVQDEGISPTLRDICNLSGICSTSTIHKYLKKYWRYTMEIINKYVDVNFIINNNIISFVSVRFLGKKNNRFNYKRYSNISIIGSEHSLVKRTKLYHCLNKDDNEEVIFDLEYNTQKSCWTLYR